MCIRDRTFDLFGTLGASDEQTDFPVIYSCAKQGKAGFDADLSKMTDIQPLFRTIIESIPAPKADASGPLQVSVANVSYDQFKGRIAIGRVVRGTFRPGPAARIDREGKLTTAKITNVMTFMGMQREDVPEARAGEIVAFAGVDDINIGETITDPAHPEALPVMKIEEPTVKMTFGVNTSPFAGKEGQFTTSRNIRERLMRELQNDVALRVEPGETGDTFVVSGRGELHLAILIETMRREGFELQVSRPQVVTREIDGVLSEPFEEAYIEVPEDLSGPIIEQLARRKGEMRDMRTENGTAYLTYVIPTRGLIGFRNECMIQTRGLGIVNTLFLEYRSHVGAFAASPHGSLIAFETGTSNSYGLKYAQERGQLFIGPAISVYEGMVVGQNAKDEDMLVNVCKEKQLTNMRSKGEGVAVQLDTPRTMGLEDALEYIGDDELVEVTPQNVRIRKRLLKEHERRRAK